MPKNAALSALLAKGHLVPCRAVAGAALAGEALPTRIKLFNWGPNERIDGPPIVVGERTLSSLAANQEALGFDRIVLDYNHQSVPGHPNFKPDPREHAAHGGVEVIKDDGLYFTALSWTPSGETNARNYPDLSPTPLLDPETHEVLFMHSVALCTQGKVKGLTLLSAQFLAPLSTNPTPENKPAAMDFKKLLCVILNLDPATATDDEINAAAEAFGKKKDEPSADVTTLTARLDAAEKAGILNDAIRAGKLVPNSVRDLPLDDFKKVVADLPEGVVPLSARTPEGGVNKGTDLTALSADDRAVAAQLGLSEADYKTA